MTTGLQSGGQHSTGPMEVSLARTKDTVLLYLAGFLIFGFALK